MMSQLSPINPNWKAQMTSIIDLMIQDKSNSNQTMNLNQEISILMSQFDPEIYVSKREEL